MSEKDLENELKKILRERKDDIKSSHKLARDFSVLSSSLIQREGKRLAKKLGANHPRVVALKAKQKDIIKNIRTTEKSFLRAATVNATAAANEAVVVGRILDENRVGVENVKVYLVDDTGNKVAGAEGIITNSDGAYLFKLPEAAVVGGKGKAKPAYRVVVESSKANKIYEEKTGVNLNVGEQQSREIVIDRSKLLRRQ